MNRPSTAIVPPRSRNAPFLNTVAGHERALRAYRRPSFAFFLFSLLLLIGAYLDVGLVVGFPMLSIAPMMLIGLVIFRRRLLSFEILAAFGIATAVYAWSLFAPSQSEYFWPRTLAYGQFLYSILTGLITFWAVTRYDGRTIVRFLGIFLPFYLALIAIEVFTPFSKVIDAYMLHAFGGQEATQTIVNNRDIGIGFGLRRPKLFVSETSYVAIWFAFAMGIKAFLDPSRRSFVPNLTLALAGFLLIRSPISIAGFLFVCVTILAYIMRRADFGLRAVILGISALAGFGLLFVLLTYIFGDRLASAQTGADYSTTYRTYGSLYAALAITRESPIFGVGIGSIDYAYAAITDTYLRLGVPSKSVYAEWRSQIQNLPSSLLTYLGWGGTIIFSIAVLAYWRRVAGPLQYFFWALLALLAATFAAFYSPSLRCLFTSR